MITAHRLRPFRLENKKVYSSSTLKADMSLERSCCWAQANGIGVSWRKHREPNSNLSVSQLPGECDRVLDFIGISEAVTPPIFREIES